MSARHTNTTKLGHGRRAYSTRAACPCGTELSCKIKRQIRHVGGKPDMCQRCNAAAMFALVG